MNLYLLYSVLFCFFVISHGRDSVCYGVLGCFTEIQSALLLEPLEKLPESPEEIDTRFYLFTSANAAEPISIDYTDTEVDYPSTDKPDRLFFQLHGYGGSLNGSTEFEPMRELLLQLNPNSHVIFVDMSKGVKQSKDYVSGYFQAVANIQVCGRIVGLFIDNLLNYLDLTPDDVHVIGHSLGAHASGFAGQWYQNITGGQTLARISGLDPAGPVFMDVSNVNFSLSSDDAVYVDVIHTSAGEIIAAPFGELGIENQVGTSDTYVNKGQSQPGCTGNRIGDSCSHVRAVYLFNFSINMSCPFVAYHCKYLDDSFFDFGPKKCQDSCDAGPPCGQMGYYSNPQTSYGVMSTTTTGSPPYC